MLLAKQIIFRRITGADFFNIYKAPGAEIGGGGQSYIDIDSVPLNAWKAFFAPVMPKLMAKNRPAWAVTINSIGLGKSQVVTIGQRRALSVSIRSQKIASTKSNRIYAWHPEFTDFPETKEILNSASDPVIAALISGLVIYLVRDSEDDFWAGWFKRTTPDPKWSVDTRLKRMFTDDNGHIALNPGIEFNETNLEWPFNWASSGVVAKLSKSIAAIESQPKNQTPATEEGLLQELFNFDEEKTNDKQLKEKIVKVRVRNTVAVKLLKQLYSDQCQITGGKYVFKKKDGGSYTEAHHLVPLGNGGFDSPFNLVVVSGHMHRMLHYANVSAIDLTKIKDNKLDITINSEKFTIRWHPKHAASILHAMKTIS